MQFRDEKIGRAEALPEAVEQMRSRTPVDKEGWVKPGGKGVGKKGNKAWAQRSPTQTNRAELQQKGQILQVHNYVLVGGGKEGERDVRKPSPVWKVSGYNR